MTLIYILRECTICNRNSWNSLGVLLVFRALLPNSFIDIIISLHEDNETTIKI